MKQIAFLFLILFTFNASSQTVYKTPSGTKYHLANCRMVTNVSKGITIGAALELGLLPCKICKPPLQNNSKLSIKKSTKGSSSTVQCKGKTKAGSRCKHKTSIGNGYCFQHNPD
ncbi:DUF5763 domain-containing protein [Flavobacterium antarcticum]|uniref:DUF5763 domain-containing protein n=1 Tax=Flavobacterium antarcticum TaxID=271155 RepID=UPI0003B4ECAE|nr:DUF5763 domain-containing protein [Flavobacterium antarcticum]